MNSLRVKCYPNSHVPSIGTMVVVDPIHSNMTSFKQKIAQKLGLATDDDDDDIDWDKDVQVFHFQPNLGWAVGVTAIQSMDELRDNDNVILTFNEPLISSPPISLSSLNPNLNPNLVNTLGLNTNTNANNNVIINNNSSNSSSSSMNSDNESSNDSSNSPVRSQQSPVLVHPLAPPPPQLVPLRSPPPESDENLIYRKKKRRFDASGKLIKLKDVGKKRKLIRRCTTISACIEQVRSFRANCLATGQSMANLNSTYVIHSRFERAEVLQPGWAKACDEAKMGSADAHEEAKRIIAEKDAIAGAAFRSGQGKVGRPRGSTNQPPQITSSGSSTPPVFIDLKGMNLPHHLVPPLLQSIPQSHLNMQSSPAMENKEEKMGLVLTTTTVRTTKKQRTEDKSREEKEEEPPLQPAHPIMWQDRNLCMLRDAKETGTLTTHKLKQVLTVLRIPWPKGAKVEFVKRLDAYLDTCPCKARVMNGNPNGNFQPPFSYPFSFNSPSFSQQQQQPTPQQPAGPSLQSLSLNLGIDLSQPPPLPTLPSLPNFQPGNAMTAPSMGMGGMLPPIMNTLNLNPMGSMQPSQSDSPQASSSSHPMSMAMSMSMMNLPSHHPSPMPNLIPMAFPMMSMSTSASSSAGDVVSRSDINPLILSLMSANPGLQQQLQQQQEQQLQQQQEQQLQQQQQPQSQSNAPTLLSLPMSMNLSSMPSQESSHLGEKSRNGESSESQSVIHSLQSQSSSLLHPHQLHQFHQHLQQLQHQDHHQSMSNEHNHILLAPSSLELMKQANSI